MDRFIAFYLKFHNFLIVNSRYLYRRITNTTDVKCYDSNNNTTQSQMLRYWLIQGLQYVVDFTTYLQSCIDLPSDKIQIIKNYDCGEKTIILESTNVKICDVIRHVSSNDLSQNSLSKTLYLKFELKNPDVCLKKYILKYTDGEKRHDHTLENILVFNDIVPNGDTVVNIEFFKDGGRVKLSEPYDECKTKHISDFS
jgi:hypothetical protein